MGVFDFFKAKRSFNKNSKNFWRIIFSSCIGKMSAIQNNAAQLVKDKRWNVDFSNRYITFDEDKYPIQFIGSESSVNNTWMWGWNNVNGFSEELLFIANQILRYGKIENVAVFKTPQFAVDGLLNGHNLSAVACSLSRENVFYYRCPHDAGAVFVAVQNAPEEIFSPVDITDFINLTAQCIKQYDIDHKIFITSFLDWNKTKFEWRDNTLVAFFSKELYISFENTNDGFKIIKMNTSNL